MPYRSTTGPADRNAGARSPDETRALFDAWADSYEHDLQQPTGPLVGYEDSLQAAAAIVPMNPGAKILDIGIGTGALAALFAERGAIISGIDPSAQMLAQCRRLHPRFTLAEGSFERIPHPAARFDAVVTAFAFHEVPPAARPAALTEIARVLKPGGTICLLDIIFASPAATEAARAAARGDWDDSEHYPLVPDLDTHLRAADLTPLRWSQTTPCHWAVVGRHEVG